MAMWVVQIVEEGSELLSRLLTGSGPLPMFTSCCPGWINLVEKSYPHLIPHLSTCKSPQGRHHTHGHRTHDATPRTRHVALLWWACAGMMGSVVKNVYAPHVGRDPSEVGVVSIMPCTAKKDEAHRTQDSRVTFSPVLGKTVRTQGPQPPPKGMCSGRLLTSDLVCVGGEQ